MSRFASSLGLSLVVLLSLTQCSQSKLQPNLEASVTVPQAEDPIEIPDFNSEESNASNDDNQDTNRIGIDPEQADQEQRTFVELFQDMFFPQDNQKYINAVLEMSRVMAYLNVGLQSLSAEVNSMKTQPGFNRQKFNVVDLRAGSDDGGPATSDQWAVRVLNQIRYDVGDNIASLSNNEIRVKPGKYFCSASAPAFYVNRHQMRVYNVTAAAVVAYGSSEYSSQNGGGVQSTSHVEFVLNLTEEATIRIEHRVQTSRATNGWGVKSGFSSQSIYSSLSCERVG